MNLEKIGKVFTSKFIGTGPSSYEKRIYRAAVSQNLRNTNLHYSWELGRYFRVNMLGPGPRLMEKKNL